MPSPRPKNDQRPWRERETETPSNACAVARRKLDTLSLFQSRWQPAGLGEHGDWFFAGVTDIVKGSRKRGSGYHDLLTLYAQNHLKEKM